MLQNHEKKEDTDTTATCSAIKRELLKVTPNLSANIFPICFNTAG